MTVYLSVAHTDHRPPTRCRFHGQLLAVLSDTEALDALRLAGGRYGRLTAVRCEPCRGWHITPRTRHEG
ncbi:hypothetical protein Lfu02_44850 [Longispora fulva]|uniref:Uncharacterized protein n=1 Tax=Longispora fulva TaxID=619741 RepID=A0A8J7GFG0_9ACTN|nr:hypothetical protein [Longispora fulva]GIG60113.1 hypothetical protein Lfu02_44850 [Longispora fulva]